MSGARDGYHSYRIKLCATSTSSRSAMTTFIKWTAEEAGSACLQPRDWSPHWLPAGPRQDRRALVCLGAATAVGSMF